MGHEQAQDLPHLAAGSASLLPPSPRECLSEVHQVYFLLGPVDVLDLSAIVIPAQSKDLQDKKGFDSRIKAMLLYSYCVGTVPPHEIESARYEDLAFRLLTGNQQAGHSFISEFHRRNLEVLSNLFVHSEPICWSCSNSSLSSCTSTRAEQSPGPPCNTAASRFG
jgi:hypothetical protein